MNKLPSNLEGLLNVVEYTRHACAHTDCCKYVSSVHFDYARTCSNYTLHLSREIGEQTRVLTVEEKQMVLAP